MLERALLSRGLPAVLGHALLVRGLLAVLGHALLVRGLPAVLERTMLLRSLPAVLERALRCRGRAAVLAACLVAGCATGPGDGPPADPPRGLEGRPDAEPRVEPLRRGGPNQPYEVFGRRYVPETRDLPMREEGLASWYGRKFHGRRTASGEVYDMYAMTAAHKTMPLPSYARVRNPANGREIVVRVNDRGPFVAGRVIDLSYAAARKLGVRGLAPVEVERLTADAIRRGAWRRDAPAPADAAPQALAAPVQAAPVQAAPVQAAPVQDAPVQDAPAQDGPVQDAPVQDGPVPRIRAASRPSPSGPEPMPAAPGMPPAGAAEAPAPAVPAAAIDDQEPGFWLQLGAFREPAGAEDFRRQVAAELDWLAPLTAVFSDAPLFRLQAGPYASRGEAQGVAERVREALRLVPVILERR